MYTHTHTRKQSGTDERYDKKNKQNKKEKNS